MSLRSTKRRASVAVFTVSRGGAASTYRPHSRAMAAAAATCCTLRGNESADTSIRRPLAPRRMARATASGSAATGTAMATGTRARRAAASTAGISSSSRASSPASGLSTSGAREASAAAIAPLKPARSCTWHAPTA